MELIEEYIYKIQRRFKIQHQKFSMYASNYPPSGPARGQIWFNANDNKLYIWDPSYHGWVRMVTAKVEIIDGPTV